ncbi:SH3 domain-containing protein [Leptospira ognonensis]|uniref:SH3 domain-containing protein n=1 Tax=Leptospira ognonensis TaxID=2484945 RepID=A0A4R9KD17_9LEPT|nr:SH3 domain-containing protein [Leptospira ognonensis]TGL63043.1 SH3 domain-containing protein [Leptospira ognonensis]
MNRSGSIKIFWSLSLFFLGFSILLGEPKSLQKKIKQIPSDQLRYKDEVSEIIVNHFQVKLYLFPDRKSDVLRVLKFGERVVYDKSTLELPNDKWIPIRTVTDGLIGHVVREAVLSVAKNRYLTQLIFETDKLLKLNSLSLVERMEITDSLFAVSTAGEYTGDDFTLSRTKAGFGLKRTLDLINEKKIKSDSSPDLLEFLKRHQSKLLYDYSDGIYYVDPNYFWKLIETNPNTKHSDYAGYLAAEVVPMPNCNRELSCELETLRKSKMRYVYQFPTGNYVSVYIKSIIKSLKEITKDPDAIACFQPLPQSIRSEINTMEKYVQEYSARHRKEILPYIRILKEECLK